MSDKKFSASDREENSSPKLNYGFLLFTRPWKKDAILITFIVLSVGLFILASFDLFTEHSGLDLIIYLLSTAAVSVVFVYLPLLIILIPRRFMKKTFSRPLIVKESKQLDLPSVKTKAKITEVPIQPPQKVIKELSDPLPNALEKFRVPIMVIASLGLFLPIALLLEPYLPISITIISAPVFSFLFIKGLKNLERRSALKAIQLEKQRKLHKEKMNKLKESMTPGEWATYLLNLEINANLKKLNEPKYQPGARFGVFKEFEEQ